MSARTARYLRRPHAWWTLAMLLLLPAATAIAQPAPSGDAPAAPRQPRSTEDVLGGFVNDFFKPAPHAEPATEPATEPTTEPAAPGLPATEPVGAAVSTTGPSTAPTAVAQAPTSGPTTAPSSWRDPERRPFTSRREPRSASPAAPAPSAAGPSTPQRSARQMTDQDKILLSRSIFTKDRRAAPIPGSIASSTIQPPPSGDGPPPIFRPTGSGPPTFALRGVVDHDGVFTALIEDPNARATLGKHIGDPVYRGRVTAITLDSIDYEVNGRRSRVRIGQPLDRGDLLPSTNPSSLYPTTQPSSSPTTNPADADVVATTEPAAGVPPTTAPTTPTFVSDLPPLPGSPEEIEKMKRRRQSELGSPAPQ